MTTESTENGVNAATPYGPGWHHHNAGRLHPNDGCSVCSERAIPPGVEGRSDPTGGDGYVPGAWDEVRSAYLDGHISAAAYEALRARVLPPGGSDA